MAYNIISGTTIRFYTRIPFSDFSGTPVDPDKVEFSYRVGSGDSVTLTYGVDPEIVRDGVGDYHVDIDTSGKSGTWTYSWYGYPTMAHTDPTRTKVKFEGNVIVSVSTI